MPKLKSDRPKKEEMIEVLTNARDIVAAGWCRGDYKKGDRYCMTGAVYQAAGWNWIKNEDQYGNEPKYLPRNPVTQKDQWSYDPNDISTYAFNLLQKAVPMVNDGEYEYSEDIVDWNDNQKSKKPVIELFNKVIGDLINDK